MAGSEAAYRLAQRGVLCVVLEQNDRPYGKIAEGDLIRHGIRRTALGWSTSLSLGLVLAEPA